MSDSEEEASVSVATANAAAASEGEAVQDATTTDSESPQSPVTNEDVVLELDSNDVLVGRGAPSIDNEGNIRFRAVVRARKLEYSSTSKRVQKDAIARQILQVIVSRGGRFLRKVESLVEAERLQVPPGAVAWMPVPEETVLLKVKQALRGRERGDPQQPSWAVEEEGMDEHAQAQQQQVPTLLSQQQLPHSLQGFCAAAGLGVYPQQPPNPQAALLGALSQPTLNPPVLGYFPTATQAFCQQPLYLSLSGLQQQQQVQVQQQQQLREQQQIAALMGMQQQQQQPQLVALGAAFPQQQPQQHFLTPGAAALLMQQQQQQQQQSFLGATAMQPQQPRQALWMPGAPAAGGPRPLQALSSLQAGPPSWNAAAPAGGGNNIMTNSSDAILQRALHQQGVVDLYPDEWQMLQVLLLQGMPIESSATAATATPQEPLWTWVSLSRFLAHASDLESIKIKVVTLVEKLQAHALEPVGALTSLFAWLAGQCRTIQASNSTSPPTLPPPLQKVASLTVADCQVLVAQIATVSKIRSLVHNANTQEQVHGSMHGLLKRGVLHANTPYPPRNLGAGPDLQQTVLQDAALLTQVAVTGLVGPSASLVARAQALVVYLEQVQQEVSLSSASSVESLSPQTSKNSWTHALDSPESPEMQQAAAVAGLSAICQAVALDQTQAGRQNNRAKRSKRKTTESGEATSEEKGVELEDTVAPKKKPKKIKAATKVTAPRKKKQKQAQTV